MKQYSYKNAPKTQKSKVQHLYVETDRNTGLLPDDVFEYTNIEILSVRILNAIPPEITQLKKLRKLSIAFWGGGALPVYIEDLKNLEELSIRVVSKALEVPETLANLVHLKKITLYDCQLKEIPSVLLKMPQLLSLEISANEIPSFDLPNHCYWPNLETLDLRTNGCQIIPDWVYQHTQLKELYLPNNKLTILPSKIGQLTKLEQLTVDNNKIETITANFGLLPQLQLFNWFENPMGWLHPWVFELNEKLLDFKLFWRQSSKQSVKDILAIKKALSKANLLENQGVVQAICLLLSDKKKAKKALSNAEVLGCYPVNHLKVRAAVMAEISSRLQPFDKQNFQAGSELLVLGTTIKKKATLKAQLKDLGIAVVTKKGAKTSHVVLGKNIKKTEALLDNALILLTETDLNHYLDEVAPAYLLEDEESTTSNVAHLRAMLVTLIDENVLIALELLKSGGVPKDLMTTLFFVHKFSKNAQIVRKSKNLLTLNASEKLLEVLKIRFNFKQNRVGFFDAKRYLEKVCTETEIEPIELLKYAYNYYSQKYPFPSLYTDAIKELPEIEQKEEAALFWNGRVENGQLFLQEGDGKIINHLFDMDIVEVLEGRHYPVHALTSQHGGAKMRRLRKLILEYKREKIRLPQDFGTLENLEELDLTNANFYEQGWEELGKLKALKKLTYQSDSTEIPNEIFSLKQLEKLVLDGKYIPLTFPISALENLKEIDVKNSSMEGAVIFVDALKKLPNLKSVQLHTALDAVYRK